MSESDESPVKSKSSRRRGLAARLKTRHSDQENQEEDVSDHATVYSTKVSKMFGNGMLPLTCTTMVKNLNTENDDVPLIIDKIADQDDCPCTPKIAKLTECTTPSTTPTILKSPTPPPPPSPPPQYQNPNRRTRLNKNLQKAIRNICDSKELLDIDGTVTRPDDQDVICLEDDEEDALTVRIKHGTDTFRFIMKKSEPFKRVICEIAEKMETSSSRVLLVVNDKTIHTHDCPRSINLQVADIVYCYISNEDRSILEESISDTTESITLFIQSKNSKQKQEFIISKNQPLDEIIRKYSIQMNVDPSKLKLQFDGEELSFEDTPNELELEEGYCLDIIHL